MKLMTGLKKEYIEYSLKILEMKPSLFSNEKTQLVREIVDLARLFQDPPINLKETEPPLTTTQQDQ